MRTISRRLVFSLLLGLTFGIGLAVGVSVSAFAAAQQATTTMHITTDTNGKVIFSSAAPERKIIEGADLGLRVDARRGKRVVGTLVTKVNGQWVEVQFSPQDSFARTP